MKNFALILIMAMFAFAFTSCGSSSQTCEQLENQRAGIAPQGVDFQAMPESDMKAKLATFASFKLTTDLSHLSEKEKQILNYFFEASKIIDNLYWKQTLGNKDGFLSQIQGEDAKKYALIHYGPWDRLDNNLSFLTNVGPKPDGANFYPQDMTKEEFEQLADSNKTSQYTVIRRDDAGKLKVLWYHEVFKSELEKAATLLRNAANLAEDEGLKKYLTLRADALLNSNYLASDLAWMDMKDSKIDFVIGPIENYEDALFGYKTSFESFILVKDLDWSTKLQKYSAMLPILQGEIPTDPKYKTEIPGANSDLNVYDVINYAGDCNAGGKTIAINLPNDPAVHVQKGTRKLQLKNAMQAKFDKIMIPIANLVIDPAQIKHVTFDAFFSNVMFHEVAHGMGVKNTVTGKGTAREALKETYSSIEEGKADIMGLWLVTKLREKGEITDGELMDNYVTFFAGIFRSSRFGAASAHGKANMMRFNYFTEVGAFTRNADGTYTVNLEKMKEAVDLSVDKIMKLQGEGDYETCKKWIETDAFVRPDLQADLDKINAGGIPVDIVFEQGPEMVGLK